MTSEMEDGLYGLRVETPIGAARVVASSRGVRRVWVEDREERQTHHLAPSHGEGGAAAMASRAAEELGAYFAGELRRFETPMDWEGTSFQAAVWRRLIRIPMGETVTYGQIAAELGSAGAARAVGLANHDNRIWVMVPCHRVVGADGSLTGYAGGLERKRWLLDHEARVAGRVLWAHGRMA